MESKGVIVLRSEEELDRLSGGTVIIRFPWSRKNGYMIKCLKEEYAL